MSVVDTTSPDAASDAFRCYWASTVRRLPHDQLSRFTQAFLDAKQLHSLADVYQPGTSRLMTTYVPLPSIMLCPSAPYRSRCGCFRALLPGHACRYAAISDTSPLSQSPCNTKPNTPRPYTPPGCECHLGASSVQLETIESCALGQWTRCSHPALHHTPTNTMGSTAMSTYHIVCHTSAARSLLRHT